MAKTKTFKDYEEGIRKAHSEGDLDKARRQADKWSALVPLTFVIANNEQLPYTDELIELGHSVEEMPPCTELGFHQTGDYMCKLGDYPLTDGPRYTGVLWERKSKNDAYGTFIHGQDAFYAELKRACDNPLVDYMLIGVECTRDKFISTGNMSAVKETVEINGVKKKVVVRDSQGKPKISYSKGATPQSRLAIVESIGPRTLYKVNIRWHSARKYAIRDLVKQNRMWLKYNYAKVLGAP